MISSGNTIIGNNNTLDQFNYNSSIIGANSGYMGVQGSGNTIFGGIGNYISSGGTNNSIVGGFNNFVPPNFSGATIIGSSGLTALTSYTTFTDNLYVTNTFNNIPASAITASTTLWSAGTGTNSIVSIPEGGNYAGGSNSFVQGRNNIISGSTPFTLDDMSIFGGENNIILVNGNGSATLADLRYSSIYGGQNNTISGSAKNTSSTIIHNNSVIGGVGNRVSAFSNGGFFSSAEIQNSSIIGGSTNHIEATNIFAALGGIVQSSIVAGVNNTMSTVNFGMINNSIILGGNFNSIFSPGSGIISDCFINGGNLNSIISPNSANINYSFIDGGINNSIYNSITATEGSSIIGGIDNLVNGNSSYSSIVAGSGNTLNNSSYSLIAGGSGNTLTSVNRSVILGGQNISGTTDDTVYVPNLNVTGSLIGGGALNSIALGGVGNNINSQSNSIIAGGSNITATSNNSLFTSDIRILSGTGIWIQTGSTNSSSGIALINASLGLPQAITTSFVQTNSLVFVSQLNELFNDYSPVVYSITPGVGFSVFGNTLLPTIQVAWMIINQY